METQDDMTASLEALPTQITPPTAEEQSKQYFEVFVADKSNLVIGDSVYAVVQLYD